MKEFVYYSKSARTSGNFDTRNLMKAGRMDIACQIVIMAFFVSHHTREDVKLHLIFEGGPDPPKHIEMFPGQNFMADDKHRIDISKKDVASLIKKLLYKYKKGEKKEVVPGYFIEKKGLSPLLQELQDQGKEICLLDRRGTDVRDKKKLDNCVFVLGDQEGIPKIELKKMKKIGVEKVSIGRQMYFASQTMTILHNELDRRNI